MYLIIREIVLLATLLVLFLITRHHMKSDRLAIVGVYLVTVFFAFFLLYKLATFPNVFVDEGNGMYDSWSLVNYGVDSHLIKNPVYLEGHVGQGQSVLYAYIAGLFMKIFGYKLFIFRLPLVLISIGTLLILIYVALHRGSARVAFWLALVVASSPYILDISRFGMDCNVAPFMVASGSALTYLGVTQKKRFVRLIQLTVGFLIIGLTAYSYNVGWMFLPIYLLTLAIFLLTTRKVKITDAILPVTLLIIEIIPIMIFAVRSNIPSLNRTVKILFWTSPELQVGRVGASFIDFKHNLVANMYHNLISGLMQFVNGTDGLSSNSVANFGPYYMFALPFFIWGLFIILKRRATVDYFVISSLVAMIPIMLVVTPNYNHWIFLHFSVLVVIGIGIIDLVNNYGKFKYALIATYVISMVIYTNQYFTLERYTGFDISALNKITSMNTHRYKKVYFASDSEFFMYALRVAAPVSPYEFQKTKDHPYSKVNLGMDTKYSNFERLSDDSNIVNNSLIILPKEKVSEYDNKLKGRNNIDTFIFDSTEYLIYR